jgi:hypothetical protein
MTLRLGTRWAGTRFARVPLTDLQALLEVIRQSPIVVRLTNGLFFGRDWASVRKSPDVDAYVLAWIASHTRRTPRRPRIFM